MSSTELNERKQQYELNRIGVLLEQELQLFVDADSIELFGRFKGRLHTLPWHPWDPSEKAQNSRREGHSF